MVSTVGNPILHVLRSLTVQLYQTHSDNNDSRILDLIMGQQRGLICRRLREVSNHCCNSHLAGTISQETARLQPQQQPQDCNHLTV